MCESTDCSIEAILKYKSKTTNKETIERMSIIKDFEYLKEKFTIDDLDKEKIYIIRQML